MKGQAINIDWSTGLALFLVTILSSVVFLIDPLTVQNQNSLDNKAMDVQNILQREGGRINHRNTFYIQSPEEIENVPFDQKYFYSNLLGTGTAEEPSYLNLPANRFATVTDTGNRSIDMTYFSGDLEPPSYYSDLEISSSEISNSEITFQYGSGIESVTLGGEEVISSANIDGSTDTSQNDVFVETFSGNLKVFNDSKEFIVEDNSFTVRTRNYSTLYWHPEGNQSTSGTGTLKSGNTRGLTLADSDLGVTFLGDLDANVSRPDSSSLKVEIDAPETRIRVHNSGTYYGEKRIEAFNRTETFFGAEKIRRSLFREDLENIANMSERDFETRFGLVNWGYNVTVYLNRKLSKNNYAAQKLSDQKDWNQGTYSGTSADRNDNSGTLGIGYLNGSASTDLTEGLVGYWRMDSSVSDGGTVLDYSGTDNDGILKTGGNNPSGATGIMSTNTFEFDGNNDYVEVPDHSTLDITEQITLSGWMKTTDTIHSAIIDKQSGGDSGYRITPESQVVEFGIYASDLGEGYTECTGTTDIVDGSWHYIVGTWDGENMTIYVDGSVDGTCTQSALATNNLAVDIGVKDDSDYFNGPLDEVRIYNRSLSQNEIEKLYLNGQNGEFNGTYTGPKTDSDETRDWSSLSIDASIPSETDLTAIVYVYDSTGNVMDSQTVNVNDGAQEYELTVQDAEDARVVLKGSSTNPEKSWEVNEVSLFTKGQDIDRNLLNKGQHIAFRDTSISQRKVSFIDSSGNVKQAESKVVLWR